MLSHRDPIGQRPRRVTVAGVSGCGKTTLSSRIATILCVPHVEIDGLFHGPNWEPRPEFMDDVVQFLAEDAWVTEWQYRVARPLIAARADLLVWLDLPFWRVTFPRVVGRTVSRRLRREPLWNGNVEPPLYTFLTDPDHIVRWSIAGRHQLDRLIPTLEGRFPGLRVVRLRTPREVEEWVARLACETTAGRGWGESRGGATMAQCSPSPRFSTPGSVT